MKFHWKAISKSILDIGGILFDSVGNYAPWMDNSSPSHYKNMTDCLVEQYSHYCEEFNGTRKCVDGGATLRENIADAIGVQVAYRALLLSQPSLWENNKE